MPLIELRHLHKAYGSVVALEDLNLEVPEACLYGLLGPNEWLGLRLNMW